MAGTATAHASQVLGNDLPCTGSARSTYSRDRSRVNYERRIVVQTIFRMRDAIIIRCACNFAKIRHDRPPCNFGRSSFSKGSQTRVPSSFRGRTKLDSDRTELEGIEGIESKIVVIFTRTRTYRYLPASSARYRWRSRS